MSILITGGSGFLGKAFTPLLLEKGEVVYSLSRHPPIGEKNLIPLVGDITEENLGLTEVPKGISALYHLAAIHRLGDDKDGSIWNTNVNGTKNVINFCAKYNIPRLYFVSTAYVAGRNVYERSKALCETLVRESDIPRVTIFKPSTVMGTEPLFFLGHFSQFVSIVVRIHQRAELIRRKVEGNLRLPIIEPVFRLKANPEGKFNLIPVDAVAKAIATIKKPGTYWLTHPNPPTIGQLLEEWVSEFIMVRIRIESDFKPNPIEFTFEKMAAAFVPYLWGDDFKSDIKDCPPITKEFIHATLKRLVY